MGKILFYRHSKGRHPWYDLPHVAAVGQFGVLPAFQRRGGGNKLMAFVERRAIATGATEIALDTSDGAAHLIGWHGRLGYRLVGHAQWTGKTCRRVILSKSLQGLPYIARRKIRSAQATVTAIVNTTSIPHPANSPIQRLNRNP